MSIIERIAYACMFIAVCATFVVVTIEWIVGCGESYVDSKGVRLYYECVFVK